MPSLSSLSSLDIALRIPTSISISENYHSSSMFGSPPSSQIPTREYSVERTLPSGIAGRLIELDVDLPPVGMVVAEFSHTKVGSGAGGPISV